MNLFSVELEWHMTVMLVLALLFVLLYEAINGFHDTANAIATVVYTRALREKLAVIMAGICNFFGVILGGLSVAYAIVHLLPITLLLNIDSGAGLSMIFSILLAAICWNLGTWYLGIPASSSHTLIGSIIGVGIMNAIMTETSIVDALNIPQIINVILSLLISPLIGFVAASITILALRRLYRGSKKRERIHLTPTLREKQDGKRKPPFWTRIMLIVSAIGVSFAHGANDGQKGIGLLMLVLIGIAPAGFVINMNSGIYEITQTRDALKHLEQYYQSHQLTLTHVASMQELPVADGEYHCNTSNILESIQLSYNLVDHISSYHELSVNNRKLARRLLMCIADSITLMANSPETSNQDKHFLTSLHKVIVSSVEYAPTWIIISVALALSIGTVIGWRRIAVTIGEKIGKTELTYAQGVSAQATTAISIGVASYTGMPVSTTQVLSSAVAGTVLADGGGVQRKTLFSIGLTWLLTLPASIILSGLLYWFMLLFIQ